MKDKYFLALVAMVLVCIIEVVALATGVDGKTFAAACAAISGLGGWSVGDKQKRTRAKNSKPPVEP